MWHGRWQYAPTAVFGMDAAALSVQAVIEGQEEWHVCHTGVLLHRGHVVVRRHWHILSMMRSAVPSTAEDE